MWFGGARRYSFTQGVGSTAFLGFTGRRVNELMGEIDVRRERPPVDLAVLEDCLVLPKVRALYRTDGVRIDATMATYIEPDVARNPAQIAKLEAVQLRDSPPTIPVPRNPIEVTETVLHLGSIFRHYGHFLTDSLARAWAMAEVDPAMRVIFAPSMPLERCPPFVVDILAALGAPAERVIQTTRPMLLRRVICPLPRMQWDRRVYPDFDAPHRAAAAVFNPSASSDLAGARVYLSRGRLGDQFRAILGQDELDRRMEREGFTIVYPEALPLGEQIGLFETAAAIVGQTGSAMHTALFRRTAAPLPVGVLTWSRVNGRFLMQDALKPLDTQYLNCMREVRTAFNGEQRKLKDHMYSLYVDRAMSLLSDAGFLSRPRRR